MTSLLNSYLTFNSLLKWSVIIFHQLAQSCFLHRYKTIAEVIFINGVLDIYKILHCVIMCVIYTFRQATSITLMLLHS